ncbi:MAG TPA: VWA domain-containing protein [Candidatus Eisenbacteria bacterium]|nr:VWA domain-containing protein [Candidatus Eisenbacteria bacterium]
MKPRQISDYAMCLALIFFLLSVLLRVTRSNPLRNKVPSLPDAQKISTEVTLVPLSVVVTDRRGRMVTGLKEGDFHVFEDGVPQSVSVFNEEDRPVTVGLVLDSSGSMQTKRAEVAKAAKDFLESSNPDDQIFVVNFNNTARLGLPSDVSFTDKVQELEAAVSRGVPEGETALYDAIVLAMQHLKTGNRDRKALVIVSDGGDNASVAGLSHVLELARRSSTIIYTIGIFDEGQSDTNPKVLKELAKETGGRTYFPESADQVPAICRQIARDLREQYTVAYSPTDRKLDGRFRSIRVEVDAPGEGKLAVRTRTGYFASAGGGPAT